MKNKSFYLAAISAFVLLTAFTLSPTQKPNEAPGGMAYAVTWKQNGYWFAVGPHQLTSAGYKTEEKAFDQVIGYDARTKGKHKHVYTCGKFEVYSLGVNYSRGDIDALDHVRKKEGYTCSKP